MNRETALCDTKAKAKLELSRYKSVRASIEIGWILAPSWPSTYIEGCLSNTDSLPPCEKFHSEVILNRKPYHTGNKTQNRSRTCSACFSPLSLKFPLRVISESTELKILGGEIRLRRTVGQEVPTASSGVTCAEMKTNAFATIVLFLS